MEALKVILRGTIRNDNFLRDTTLQYWNIRQQQFFAQHNLTAILEQCCNHSKQCCNNVATLCCAKNRPCESSRLTSPLRRDQDARLRSGTIRKDLPIGRTHESHY